MAKAKKPFAALPMLKEAWFFFWKQPALLRVALWMVGLTSFFAAILGRVIDPTDTLSKTQLGLFLAENDPESLFAGFVTIILGLVSLWGMCGILVVGRRMIGARSGRTRTSFTSVLNEGSAFVRPVLFCELAMFALIGIPLAILFFLLQIPSLPIVAAVAILIVTILGTYFAFGPISIVCDDKKTSRGALRHSIALVRGKFFRTLKCVLIFAIAPLLTAIILGTVTDSLAGNVWMALAGDFVTEVLMSILTAIFVLAMVLLYGKLRDAPKQIKL